MLKRSLRIRRRNEIRPPKLFFIAILLIFFCVASSHAHELTASPSYVDQDPELIQSSNPPPSAAQSDPQPQNAKPKEKGQDQDQSREEDDHTKDSKPKDDDRGKQTNRMLWVVPNFAAVSANEQLPPLSTKGKFKLASEDSFDYSSFVWTGIISGQGFGLKNYPEFGQGVAGYARYYWHSFVDGVSGTYFTEAIIPWLTHEDPRYYTMERGGFPRRIGYALSRVVMTKTDSGGTSFNWSEIGGNLLEAGLSNAYYPREERGWRQTGINWGDQLESAALNNIAKEFWPDIRRYVFRRK